MTDEATRERLQERDAVEWKRSGPLMGGNETGIGTMYHPWRQMFYLSEEVFIDVSLASKHVSKVEAAAIMGRILDALAQHSETRAETEKLIAEAGQRIAEEFWIVRETKFGPLKRKRTSNEIAYRDGALAVVSAILSGSYRPSPTGEENADAGK